jgi:hypothetical protein
MMRLPVSFAAEPLGDARSVVEGAPYGVTPQLLWAGSEFLELWSGAGAGRDDAGVFASRRDAAGGEYGFIWSDEDASGYGYRVWFQRATFCD